MKKNLIAEGNIYVSGVYGIYTKSKNGRREYLYIGSSKECNDAKSRHQSLMRNEKYANGKKQFLQECWDSDVELYFGVIEEVTNYEDRVEAEQYYIDKYSDCIVNGQDKAQVRNTPVTVEEHRRRSEANRGENNPNSRLTKKQVWEIRYLYDNTDMKQYEIAKMYKISTMHVSNIINNRKWR